MEPPESRARLSALAHIWPMVVSILWLAIAGLCALEKKYTAASCVGASGVALTALVALGVGNSRP
jgi:hypothetical protein